MSLKVYCSDHVESIIRDLEFVSVIDNHAVADVTIDVGPIRGLPHITIEDSLGALTDEDIRKTVTDLFKSKYPVSHGSWKLNKSDIKGIGTALRQVSKDNKSLYQVFFSEYTNVMLTELRAEYTVQMINAFKDLINNENTLYSFLCKYSGTNIDPKDVKVTGTGIWSPELFNAYMVDYLLLDCKECKDIYAKYIEERNGNFLLKKLREFCNALSADNFMQVIDELDKENNM